jgi:hypothetical protein
MFDLDNQSNLTLVVRDQVGRFFPLPNDRGSKIKNGTNGYESADWTLDREFGFAWDDQGLNNQVFYYTGFGDEVFHGRLESIAPTWESGICSLNNSARGYKDSTADIKFFGSLIGTPEARIAALIAAGYFPQLSTDTSGLITTGIASGTTATDNSGTDDKTPWDMLILIFASLVQAPV